VCSSRYRCPLAAKYVNNASRHPEVVLVSSYPGCTVAKVVLCIKIISLRRPDQNVIFDSPVETTADSHGKCGVLYMRARLYRYSLNNGADGNGSRVKEVRPEKGVNEGVVTPD
jgi:hypothetical protein